MNTQESILAAAPIAAALAAVAYSKALLDQTKIQEIARHASELVKALEKEVQKRP